VRLSSMAFQHGNSPHAEAGVKSGWCKLDA
jgi:hypothetical protein